MSSSDRRVKLVLDITGGTSISDITASDYEKVEDNYISAANELYLSDQDIEALKKAGFEDLASKIISLKDAADAYDWSRENL